MKEIKIDDNQISAGILELVSAVIQAGGLVVFPSDTVFGIMAKLSEDSLKKIDRLKQRTSGKNYAVIYDSLESVLKTMKLSKKQQEIIKNKTPGLFTFVVKPEVIYNENLRLVLSPDGKIGIRIPDSELMRRIASRNLVLATSANLSGHKPVYTVSELKEQLDFDQIDLIIDGDLKTRNLASTVVDISDPKPIILRQGSGQI